MKNIMEKSIQQKYEERNNKTSFKVKGVYFINPNKLKMEIEEFVKGFQPDKEVSIIEFDHFPFYAVKSIFVRFILCFPAVKYLRFWNCTFSDKNFQNFQKF
eukprot:snap_masked-scaffold_61-processed-gene-0.18-mRNA-1 protein AED:1.00 eAED:1.00 QI:0/0/0/0/1/1/4/0/100